ncbi:MAG: NnrS family protein [Burkholderiaceae bacterium]
MLFNAGGTHLHDGALSAWTPRHQAGHQAGLYLIIGLILMMGRRVVPVFITSGVPEAFEPRNSRTLDVVSLLAYLVFFGALLWPQDAGASVAALAAGLIFAANLIRLAGWHTPGIWRRPLVWVLYLGMCFITLGFLLHVLAHAGWIAPSLAVHAFAYGGIGLMTLGMMSRVSLGHSGRNIHQPAPAFAWAFALLTVGALVRVFGPLLWPQHTPALFGLAQALWMLSFGVFLLITLPMLTRARVDGRPG